MDKEKSTAPGSEPEAMHIYEMALDELEEAISIAKKGQLDKNIEKSFLCCLENDLEKLRLTIIFPKKVKKIVLNKSQLEAVISHLKDCYRELK